MVDKTEGTGEIKSARAALKRKESAEGFNKKKMSIKLHFVFEKMISKNLSSMCSFLI